MSQEQIRWWVRTGILTRTRPKVYALGYRRSDETALLWEAVLYAGPRAYLTGASGAHRLGLLNESPPQIKVATPWRRRSCSGIIVLSSRQDIRLLGPGGIPVAPLPELMLELAAEGDFTELRFALGNLEFARKLDIAAFLAVCTPGRRGAKLLRRALEKRLPELANCRSRLEVAFLLLLEAAHLPLPLMNRWVCGRQVDAYWPHLSLVVELDGNGNHGTAAQQRRDAENTAMLTARGLTVRRFSWNDVHLRPVDTLGVLNGLGVRRTAGAR